MAAVLRRFAAAAKHELRRVARPRNRAGLRLTAGPQRVISATYLEGALMGWWAIGLIVAFVVGIGVLNRVEFGHFD
ncbi:MAG TPA: hypothetical protein VN814_01005 [Caulobacteraceae bacterium]|nr:hypothetical protein [Caulobacteraceae bacterium]